MRTLASLNELFKLNVMIATCDLPTKPAMPSPPVDLRPTQQEQQVVQQNPEQPPQLQQPAEPLPAEPLPAEPLPAEPLPAELAATADGVTCRPIEQPEQADARRQPENRSSRPDEPQSSKVQAEDAIQKMVELDTDAKLVEPDALEKLAEQEPPQKTNQEDLQQANVEPTPAKQADQVETPAEEAPKTVQVATAADQGDSGKDAPTAERTVSSIASRTVAVEPAESRIVPAQPTEAPEDAIASQSRTQHSEAIAEDPAVALSADSSGVDCTDQPQPQLTDASTPHHCASPVARPVDTFQTFQRSTSSLVDDDLHSPPSTPHSLDDLSEPATPSLPSLSPPSSPGSSHGDRTDVAAEPSGCSSARKASASHPNDGAPLGESSSPQPPAKSAIEPIEICTSSSALPSSSCSPSQPPAKRTFSTVEFYNLMKTEANRLNTFKFNGWPSEHVQPVDLAKCGFYYLLTDDRVQCAFCKIVLWDWKAGYVPVKEHLDHNPRCRFLSGYDVGNVPIDIGPVQLVASVVGDLDVCGPQSTPVSRVESPDVPVRLSAQSLQNLQQLQRVDQLAGRLNGLVGQAYGQPTANPAQLRQVTFDSFDVDDIDDLPIEVEEFEPIQLLTPSRQKSQVEQAKSMSPTVPANREQLLRLMCVEAERLRTFETNRWPLDFVRPKDLARAGFYYTMSRDKVQCAFCETLVWDWEPGDRPIVEHLRHNPNCPYLTGQASQNKPISQASLERALRVARQITGQDVCPMSSASSDDLTDPDTALELEQIEQIELLDVEDDYQRHLTQVPTSGQNLRFVTFQSRKDSFDRYWPVDGKIDPTLAAEAGFYCIGARDYVRCFSCGGGLCDWTEGDDAWAEHAKWYPKCEFLSLNKDADFILRCQKGQPIHVETNEAKTEEDIAQSQEDEVRMSGRFVSSLMESDLIRELMRIQPTDRLVLERVLRHRWVQSRRPFDNLAELFDAIHLCEIGCLDTPPSVSRQNSEPDQRKRPLGHPPTGRPTSDPASKQKISTGSANTVNRPKRIGAALCTGSTASSISPTTSDTESEIQTPVDQPLPPPALDESTTTTVCKICFDGQIAVAFLPCGHLCACAQCASAVRHCPVCRIDIQQKVRTFFT